VPVAIGDTLVGAFVAGSADHLGGFDLDQLMELQADRLTDQIDTITSAERVEQLGQGSSDRAVRTGQTQASPSFASPHGVHLVVHTENHADGPTAWWTPVLPPEPTTSRDDPLLRLAILAP